MARRKKPSGNQIDRRQFVKRSAALGAAVFGAGAGRIFAAGSDVVRVGVIGCGGRGTYDATNCLRAAENVELVAMADLFQDRLEEARTTLTQRLGNKVKVANEACFVGWDAYKKLLARDDVDLVILTTPPHFRPMHIAEAVKAGKHIFAEKPVAVDPVGVRSVMASAEIIDQKKLTFVAGTQMRRIAHLVAGMQRLHDGAIGELVSGQCVRLGGGMTNWGPKPQADWSQMEWHLRRWLFVTWLSGDFIAEMHVHNLDLVNWAFGAHPVKCTGLGGRQVRTEPQFGNVYDHMSVEYEYPGGVRVEYMGAQIDKITFRNDQWFVGTKGRAYMDFANTMITGENPFTYDGPSPSPVLKQHADQIAAIRNGQRLNEGKRIAESSLTAIMGRMSAYTGRALKWDWALNASKLDLSPDKYAFGDIELRPVAMPGRTQLV